MFIVVLDLVDATVQPAGDLLMRCHLEYSVGHAKDLSPEVLKEKVLEQLKLLKVEIWNSEGEFDYV